MHGNLQLFNLVLSVGANLCIVVLIDQLVEIASI
jgi:hypothetical protein